MKEIWVIVCNGFQGSRRFDEEWDAKNAADLLRAISGQPWEARKVIVPEK